jgi:NADPH:quinone reductase-like Zn-dependent oxidoreductase
VTTISTSAIVLEGYGAPNMLQPGLIEVPEPAPHQLRITVRYAGVGPTDLEIRAGHLDHVFPSPPGTVLGFEVAGIVETVGSAVTGIARGDEVAAFLPGLGGYARLALADHWVLKPAHMSFTDAAALPASGEAAARVLTQLGVRSAETLLIIGGAGSVGRIATQLAVARGAQVLMAVRRSDHGLATALGAIPVTYGDTLVEQVRRLVGRRVDAVLDAATGSDLQAAVDLAGGPERVITLSNHDAPALGVSLSGPDPAHADTALAEVMTAASGTLHLRPQIVLPLESAAEAHARIAAGERAKFLLEVQTAVSSGFELTHT